MCSGLCSALTPSVGSDLQGALFLPLQFYENMLTTAPVPHEAPRLCRGLGLGDAEDSLKARASVSLEGIRIMLS